MKAVQFSHFGGTEVLELVDLPEPAPGPQEVLIEVHASGVNYVDIRERQGIYQRPDTHVGSDKGLPRVSGLQVVGMIVDAGSEVDRTLIGKKAVALLRSGGYLFRSKIRFIDSTWPLKNGWTASSGQRALERRFGIS